MKVLEVKSRSRIVSPHQPEGASMHSFGMDTFKARDGYTFELHASGLAVFITGRSRTLLTQLDYASVEFEPVVEPVVVDEPAPVTVKKGKGK